MIESKIANASLQRIIEHLNKLWPDETSGIARNWQEKKWTPEALWHSLKEIARSKAQGGSYCATDEEVFGWAAHLVVDEMPGKTPKAMEETPKPKPKAKPEAKPKKEEPKPEPEAKLKWTSLDPSKDYTAETWKDLEGKEAIKKSDCEQMTLFG